MDFQLRVLVLTLLMSPLTCYSTPVSLPPGLAIDTLTVDQVHGSYYHPGSELGIVFNTTTDSLIITTLDGDILLKGDRKLTENLRKVNIGEQAFLQHSEHGDLSLSKSHEVLLEGADDQQLASLFEQQPDNTHTEILSESISNLLGRPEIQLLKMAAVSLGELGISGKTYPSILPFFMASMRLSSRDTQQALSYVDHLRLRRSSRCFSSCPPCPDKQCLGLCGPGCECWEWACGDCCYHKGCHSHDLCCREKPNSIACMLPLEFDCKTEYKCGQN